MRDFYPAEDKVERKIYKYYCPICLRYFNTILVANCCDNYICRFCIGAMAKKAKTDSNYRITCSHCTSSEYKLFDVDPLAPLRVYTDTPFKLQSSVAKSPQKDASVSKPQIDQSAFKKDAAVAAGNAKQQFFTPDSKQQFLGTMEHAFPQVTPGGG